jgi:hypothetical protein
VPNDEHKHPEDAGSRTSPKAERRQRREAVRSATRQAALAGKLAKAAQKAAARLDKAAARLDEATARLDRRAVEAEKARAAAEKAELKAARLLADVGPGPDPDAPPSGHGAPDHESAAAKVEPGGDDGHGSQG